MKPFPELYNHLAEVARRGGTVILPDLAPVVNLKADSPETMPRLIDMLGQIGAYEHFEQRPLLPAVAVDANTGYPPPAFFRLARDLGELHGRGEMEELDFFVRELKRVHAHWKRRAG